MKRKIAGLLAAAMVIGSLSGVPAWGSVPAEGGAEIEALDEESKNQGQEDREEEETGGSRKASPSNADETKPPHTQERDEDEDEEEEEDSQEEAGGQKATPSNADKASPSDAQKKPEGNAAEISESLLASPSNAMMRKGNYGANGIYVLQAEDRTVAKASLEDTGNDNNGGIKYHSDGDRVELQPGQYMTFDLSVIEGFEAGKYLLSARLNGNPLDLFINNSAGEKIGTIERTVSCGNDGAPADTWGAGGMLQEYCRESLTLSPSDQLQIGIEGSGKYGHLDWIQLEKVDEVFWIEAEDTKAVTFSGDAKVHGDGDRVEINVGGSLTVDLSEVSGFQSGTYRLRIGANGQRQELDFLAVTNGQETEGAIKTPGRDWYAKGTCEDCAYEGELGLNETSTITFSDADDWGHVDYIRLERTGDYTPTFFAEDEEAGIQVSADEGVLAEGTEIVTDTVPPADRREIREHFLERDQKIHFFSFTLKNGNETVDLGEAADQGTVTARLRVPESFRAGELELYYMEDADSEPEQVIGSEESGDYLEFQLVKYGIYIITAENYWQLEGEDFYSKTTDGGAAADLAAKEAITFQIPDDESFEQGPYNLTIRVKGYQNYEVAVNGKAQGNLEKPGIAWEEAYGEFAFRAPLELDGGDRLTLTADDQVGWVDCIRLVPCEPFEETDDSTDVEVSAESGVVPAGTELVVESVEEGSKAYETIASALGTAGNQTLQFSFYDISLLRDGAAIQPSGTLQIRLPIPDGFAQDAEELSVYYVSDQGRRSAVEFEVEEGRVVFETDHLSWYGILNQALANELYYEGENFYTGDNTAGKYYADLQPGDWLEIPLDSNAGFAEGTYEIGLRACAHRIRYVAAVNGQAVGLIERGKSDFAGDQMAADWDESWLQGSVRLKEGDILSLYAMTTKKDGSGPYGWVDYVKLKQTKGTAEEYPVLREISLEAENYAPNEKESYDTSPDGVINLSDPSYRLELPITLADGFAPEGDDYLFTMYTTGVMRSYEVEVNGQLVLSGERAGSGYDLKNMTREVGESLIHLKPGDILAVSFLEQEEGNNWGNYIDRIVLNSSRKAPSQEIGLRTGARIAADAVRSLLENLGPRTGSEDGRLLYEGEAYYTKQNDNPAADLQPGEQIRIPVSDNGEFRDGNYRVLVRSCGNREVFTIRVNGLDVGSISRGITDYGMEEMTTDGTGGGIFLKAGDILAIEGEAGAKYGWVDYVALEPVSEAQAVQNQARYTYEAEDFYTRQKDNPAADLQPGEEIVIPLHSNPDFKEGTYYILAVSCGDRTAIDVKVNGSLLGSITRNKTNFAMSAMTMDALQRPVRLAPGDTIALCSPGEKGSDSGPWGWVDQMVLMEAPGAQPQDLEEYRYPGQAYGKASTFLPSADLQPGEALVIPLSDNRRFKEGIYRLVVVSNGTRERFEVYVNGQLAGNILREPSDYGDNGMSWDALPQTLHLRPEDTVTIRGQEGEFFGWVSALVLEPVK